jgi:hypothetical protein
MAVLNKKKQGNLEHDALEKRRKLFAEALQLDNMNKNI